MSHLWKNVDLGVKIMVLVHLEEHSQLVCLGLTYKLKNEYSKSDLLSRLTTAKEMY